MENTEKRNETGGIYETAAEEIKDVNKDVDVENEKRADEEMKSETTASQEAVEKIEEPAKETEEEVVFAGGDEAEEKSDNGSSDDSEEVVFAAVSKKDRHSHIPVQRSKKKFPVTIVAAFAAVLLVGAGAFAIGMNMNSKDSKTASKETSGNTSAAEGSTLISSESADPAELSPEMPVIENVDTTSILFGKGVTVEGVDLAGKTLAQAYDAMQQRLVEIREPISIVAVCDGKSISLNQNDFNYDTNVSSVLLQAYHYSRGELDSPTVDFSVNGDTTDFKIVTAINTESVDAAIDKTADFFDVKPIDAHVTSFDPTAVEKFTFEDGKDGFMIDHDELSRKIKGILDKGEKSGTFSIETHQTHFKVSLEDIKANTRLIASHCTTAANKYTSVQNMELAIKAANGTIVGPGEVFSFNEMTGDTTNGDMHYYPNGVSGAYVPSTAYSKGEIVQDFGGGICQASTTLYLCALKADMQILQRRAHMYASSYAHYGLDATIDYGNIDMKFKNPYDYPIYIATYVYDNNYDGYDELMVEIYGPLSEEFDEIVPVGWVTDAGNKRFSATGAKVYFKNGKEIKREFLPSDSYDYHYEGYYTVIADMPADVNFGPAVYPTYTIPTVYSPGGCGSSAPIAYGTASDVLSKVRNQGSDKKTESSKSEQSGTYVRLT